MQCCTNLPPVTQNFASQEPLRDQSVELWQIFHSRIKLRPSEDLMTNHVSLLKHLPYSSPTNCNFSVWPILRLIPGLLSSAGASEMFWNRSLQLAREIKAHPWLTISNQAFALSLKRKMVMINSHAFECRAGKLQNKDKCNFGKGGLEIWPMIASYIFLSWKENFPVWSCCFLV